VKIAPQNPVRFLESRLATLLIKRAWIFLWQTSCLQSAIPNAFIITTHLLVVVMAHSYTVNVISVTRILKKDHASPNAPGRRNI